MKVILVLSVLTALAHAGNDVPKPILKKLAYHHLMSSCWGEKNVEKWYEIVGKAMEKCQNLRPTFDLDIFDENKRPTGLGLFGPQQSANRPLNRFSSGDAPNNPYEAWLAFLAFQNSQKNGGRRFRRESRQFRREGPSAEEIAEFVEDVEDYKYMTKDVIGNATCVLADMGILDSNLEINLKWYTEDVWNSFSNSGVDRDFKERLNRDTEDCYAIAQAIPQSILDRNPIYKRFGRTKIFLKCQHKAELGLCAKQDIHRYLAKKYGLSTAEERVSWGLPEDKFDAALMTKKVMWASKSDTEKYTAKIIFGMEE